MRMSAHTYASTQIPSALTTPGRAAIFCAILIKYKMRQCNIVVYLVVSILSSLLISSSSSALSTGTSRTHGNEDDRFEKRIVNVAVIGSGIGGASVSHFLHAQKSSKIVYNITVFERDDKVGGRTRSVSYFGREYDAGAAVIHQKNLYLKNMSKLLGLEETMEHYDERDGFGIFDGHQFVYKSSPSFPVRGKTPSLCVFVLSLSLSHAHTHTHVCVCMYVHVCLYIYI